MVFIICLFTIISQDCLNINKMKLVAASASQVGEAIATNYRINNDNWKSIGTVLILNSKHYLKDFLEFEFKIKKFQYGKSKKFTIYLYYCKNWKLIMSNTIFI